MPGLVLTLLGGFTARRAGEGPVRFTRRKAAALLAYLACGGAAAHPRDKLAALLWPDASDAQARHSLRQVLASLRQALPPGALRRDDVTVALEPGAVEVDVLAFQQLVAEGTPAALAQAAAAYTGDLLAGVDVKDAPSFEEWLQSERERLREVALEALARLLAWQREAEDLAGALHTALRLLALDPLQEVMHRMVMRLQAAQGRRDAALRQYQTCVALLQRELGVEPEAETKRLYGEILRQRGRAGGPVEGPREAEPPPAVAPAPIRDLEPWDGVPMIGREAELRRLHAALTESGAGRRRLLMVQGEAGIGKSRLLEEFRSGALARGAGVLVGRSYQSAQIVPFGPWVDALRHGVTLEEAARGLDPTWRRELGRLFPELGERGRELADAPDDPGALFEGVARLLEHLAGSQPLVVLLEDVHWADGMTVRLLAFLARRPRPVPLVLVASARDEELTDGALLEAVLGELAAERRLERLVLPPLSKAQTAELTQRLSRPGSDATRVAALAERLWTASGGHPFMIVETMNALDESPGAGIAGGLPLPMRVREVITGRLDRLTERARALVAVAAIIDHACDFSLLRQAAGLDEGEAATAVEELVRRRILRVVDERFDFTHERIREVAVSQILPPRRRFLHRQVAGALEAMGPEAPGRDQVALVDTLNGWLAEWDGRPNFMRLRYEDVRADPEGRFRAMLEFLGFAPPDEAAWAFAVTFSRFENMQAMEASGQFATPELRPGDVRDADSFKTRRGKVGGFRDYLAAGDQEYASRAMARLDPRFGYDPGDAAPEAPSDGRGRPGSGWFRAAAGVLPRHRPNRGPEAGGPR